MSPSTVLSSSGPGPIRGSATTKGNGVVKAVPHLTVAERVARGKAARAEVPRASHADYQPPRRPPRSARRCSSSQATTRVPELVPIRYGRMLVSPFTFYRGAALIMASDLAATPRSGLHGPVLRRRPPVELRRVRLAGAPARVRPQRLRRDAARAVGVGRQAPRGEHADRRAVNNGFPVKDQERIVLDTVAALPHGDGDASPGMKNLDVWYAHLDIEAALAELGSQFKPEDGQANREGAREGAHARTACRRSPS